MRRLLSCLALLIWLAGHAAAAETQVVDDRGQRTQWAQPPQRIVSLLPSVTESVCALGACDRLVGVDDYSNWPAQAKALPHVGGLEDANVERIVALRPDVVLLSRSARVTGRLEALGLRVLAFEPDSLADLQRVLGQVGALLGREAQAQALWRDTNAGVDQVAASLPAQARGQRIYFEVSSGPYAASESSFIGQVLARLGAANVVPGSMGPFPKLNPEFVVKANPQVIMLGDRNTVPLSTRPGWQGIEAVRRGRICVFTNAQGDVLVRPGPRVAEAAQIMADCLASKPAAGEGGAR
ncbi:ABC transporter substrate-binding protein [Variovorax sp. OV329]|uniref:ABC transporter substrate-binding protein n=1 Tax=Variovorax sp. OV329 TaxID=1882825 RepID=UPI0008E1E6D2|nr:ABC transporter substrate-binding protein [Variovorax sp. OV329]SFM46408.1 iron complex transport system substrate-binding protein [Variovorax sp. OV329]